MMRKDIQCLRGIAILLVLLYHLYPSVFVNGFLGVDIFFVISGYLMGRTLTHKKLESIPDFLKFYYRRFKRILPLYYLTLILALLAVQFLLEDFWWPTNHRYSRSALFLSTNMQLIIDSADYFNEFLADSSSMNAFIHTWSLGVEMQFYIIVPFLFNGLQVLKSDRDRLIAVIFISIFGWLIFSISSSKLTFNFMACRLWQFLVGFIAVFWMKMKEFLSLPSDEERLIESSKPAEEGLKNQIFITAALVVILCTALPYELQVIELRPLVTLATAFLILIPCELREPNLHSFQNIILNSSTLAYIGDISYVMYLVHWPIIIILNVYFITLTIIHLTAILISSILLHHLFEKHYVKWEPKAIISLVVILIVGNIALQYRVKGQKSSYPLEIERIIEENQKNQERVWESDQEMKNCSERSLTTMEMERVMVFGDYKCNESGNLSIMMLGNSYTMNIQKTFRSLFKGNYSEWRTISLSENNAIYDDTLTSQRALQVAKNQVEKYKPDVLVIMSRYSHYSKAPFLENETDDLLTMMNENLEFYQRFVKRIYILDAFPLYTLNFLNKFLHYVARKRNKDDKKMKELHLDKQNTDEEMKHLKERLRRINCKKCRLIDLKGAFDEDGKYLTFDRKTMLSYVDNTIHLTEAGVQKCAAILEDVTKEILDIFD